MPGTPLTLDYHIRTVSPLGLANTSGAFSGTAALTGSTLKGATRQSGVAVMALLGRPACRHDADPTCPLCRLFGAPGLDAAIRWGTATLDGGTMSRNEPYIVPRRSRVGRSTGTSPREPVSAGLAVPGGMLFQARVQGWLATSATADAALLVAALERLEYLGRGRTAGHGRVSVQVGAVRLAGEEWQSAELLSTLLTQEAV